MKPYQVLCSIGLNNVGIILRDGIFESDIGIVKLHPSRGTQWIAHINESTFDSSGSDPTQRLSKSTIKPNGQSLYSEYKIQGLTNKRGAYCASFFLYKI